MIKPATLDGFRNLLLGAVGRALSPAGRAAKLLIIIYHRVLAEADPLLPDEPTAAEFELQMSVLAGQGHVLPLSEAVERLAAGALPAHAMCVTFDDGYANNATVALPILRKLGVPATFFVATGFLDGGIMWNDCIVEAIRNTSVRVLDLSGCALGSFPVNTVGERLSAISRLIVLLRHETPERRQSLVDRVVVAASVSLPTDLMLRSEQVRALRAAGMTIGGHTVTHPILSRLNPEKAELEIMQGKQRLEEIIGEPITLFAYPNGRPVTDYLPEHVQMVRRAGFKAAVSTAWGAARHGADLFQLPRAAPWDRGAWRVGARLLLTLRQAEASNFQTIGTGEAR